MTDDAGLQSLSRDLVAALTAAGKRVATAESCTGGWIAKAITDVAGSSAVFEYGIVSYSNAAKETLLSVGHQVLVEHGAVSGPTVEAMAEGAIRAIDADMSVAVSGIAGPGGGTAEKPVGTVWFAWSVRSGDGVETTAERRQFDGDRDAVRRATVLHALGGILDRLS